MRLLVTGGLGYVGSFTARALAGAGHDVVILDNLSTGHRGAAGALPVVAGDCRDVATVSGLLEHRRIEAVLHFAGLSEVGASALDPAGYYAANVGGILGLLQAMRLSGVPQLVFSSSAAVYGEPRQQPIPEDAPIAPVNPYGRSKAMAERILEDAAGAGQVRAVCLRYFNAAGASKDGRWGEDHRPESHLVPRVLKAILDGTPVTVYGGDYPTPDGTAVRDYIHVEDLAQAHLRALELLTRQPFSALNLGTGQGHSVREILQAAQSVTGKPIRIEQGPRRKGDPAVLVASPDAFRSKLGWEPSCSEINEIIESAYRWHSSFNMETKA